MLFDSRFICFARKRKRNWWKWHFHWPEGERAIMRKIFEYDENMLNLLLLHYDQMKLCKWISKRQCNQPESNFKQKLLSIYQPYSHTTLVMVCKWAPARPAKAMPKYRKTLFLFCRIHFRYLALAFAHHFWLLIILWVSKCNSFGMNADLYAFRLGLVCLLRPHKSFPSQELWKNSER